MKSKLVFCAAIAACCVAVGAVEAVSLDLPMAEFGRYYERITGRPVPAGTVSLAIDSGLAVHGRDAYAIVSSNGCVRIVGSNLRSVYYGVYDLLERRA